MAGPSYKLTVNFDNGIESIYFSYGSNYHTFSTSGELYTFSLELANDINLTVTLKSSYSLDNSTLGTTSGNTIVIPENEISTSMVCTITSKLVTPRISIDLTTLSGWESLSDGDHTITIVAKADGYRDSEPSEGVTVTKEAGVTLITFTIDGTSYQAEEGMTWGEWVDSSYNTDGFAVFTNMYIALNASKLVSANSDSSGSVLTSDVIESNYSYQLAGSGSGN